MAERRRRNARLPLYSERSFVRLRRRVAANVRRLRREQELTQAEAAERAGLGLRVWQAVEGGEANTTLLTISRVCAGLGVDVAEIFAPAKLENPKRRRGRPPSHG